MAVDTRLLRQLAAVTKMRFVAGRLELPSMKDDTSSAVMLFDRRAAQ